MLVLWLSVLGGVGMAHFGLGPDAAWCWILGLVLIMVWQRRTLLTLMLLVLFGLCLGGWRGSIYMNKLAAYEMWQYSKITIAVRAMDDAVYDKHKQLAFNANNLVMPDGQRLTGQIQVSGFGENAVFQGDEVLVTGKLYPGYGA